ncbi:MAG: UDP-3-O-(3-hydroxymyristoyl)glucosamine N-acyltransferase [Chthoniobacterales bacterium]|nr:UDP-3-O-(3-hydroxymyristoyl)glucosamine N-acyltransferase [Chthoniobacterales bacterium]
MPTVSELAALVGGEVFSGSGDTVIDGPAALGTARPGEISFFSNSRYAADLRTTQASAVLVPHDFAGETPAACIRVDNPSGAFVRITETFLREPTPPPAGIHPSAVVHPGAQVAPDASVGEQAVVMPGAVVGPRSIVMAGCYVGQAARIGAGCLLHPHAIVRHGCVLGDRVTLHPGAVIGSDGFGFDTSGGQHRKIPQSGIVVLENDVEIGANTTIDRARFGRTVIGEGTKIDNLVMIAHNVVIGKHCIVCAQVGIAGSAQIGDGVILAGQAGIVGHLSIGDGAIIGAQTGVSNDVEPGARVVGSPPRPIGQWKRSIVRVDKLGELYDRVKKLEAKVGGV